MVPTGYLGQRQTSSAPPLANPLVHTWLVAAGTFRATAARCHFDRGDGTPLVAPTVSKNFPRRLQYVTDMGKIDTLAGKQTG